MVLNDAMILKIIAIVLIKYIAIYEEI